MTLTLNTARKIETAFDVVTFIVLLPFILVIGCLELLTKLFTLPIDYRNWLCHKVGNMLMNASDAVKDGKIKNEYCIKNFTARIAWKQLSNNKNANEDETKE